MGAWREDDISSFSRDVLSVQHVDHAGLDHERSCEAFQEQSQADGRIRPLLGYSIRSWRQDLRANSSAFLASVMLKEQQDVLLQRLEMIVALLAQAAPKQANG